MTTLKETILSTFTQDAVEEQHASVTTLRVPRARFAEAAKELKKGNAFLAGEWATDETAFGQGFGIYACFRRGPEYLIIKSLVPAEDPTFPSLTKKFTPAYRFERQMKSFMGVTATGNPDQRPWIKHEDWPEEAWPLRKTFTSGALPRVPGEYQWISSTGEGVYEIPVGPVHAGIIEPGHFRFLAVGEDVLNLEEKLGYVHKGIEKRFESMSWTEAARLAGRVSGDTTVAHSLAFSRAVENMTGTVPPERALWLRAVFLERERIANHLGDVAAICNDVAFALLWHQFMRQKEILLRTNLRLFGHRFMMDRIVPGGTTVDIDREGIKLIQSELDAFEQEFERIVRIYDNSSSLEDRLRTTGILSREQAEALCVVGFIARSCGIGLDCRVQDPFAPYDRVKVNMKVLTAGDVSSRSWIRIEEIRDSIRIIRELLATLPSGGIMGPTKDVQPGSTGFAAVEGWRGEILYWLQAGPKGEINRCMVRDPSSLNWLGLEQCIHGNIVPDFPVCNKSFNQSYSGHDL